VSGSAFVLSVILWRSVREHELHNGSVTVGVGYDGNRHCKLTYDYARTILYVCCSRFQALFALFQMVTQCAGNVVQHVYEDYQNV
jgi:hypothetical protein